MRPQSKVVPLRPPNQENKTERAPSTFEGVYERYVDDVWRFVRRLGVGDGHVEDVLQDVFLVVHRRLAEFEGRSSLRTWIYGIALNIVRNQRRKVARAPEPLEGDAPDLRAPGPCADAERSEALRILDGILGVMDEAQREVFVMAEVEQLTGPEMAELLDLKLPTVYSRLASARKVFKREAERRRGKQRRAG